MGVDTKAILCGNINPIEIAETLISEYGTDRNHVDVRFTFTDDYYQICFYHANKPKFTLWSGESREWDANNRRQMSVHYNIGDITSVTSEPATLVTLGWWGESVQIMETLLRKYGGWIMRNDSADEWEVFSCHFPKSVI